MVTRLTLVVAIALPLSISSVFGQGEGGGPPPRYQPPALVSVGRPGQEIRLESHLGKGRTTLFAFKSRHCGACRAMEPELERLASSRQDLTLRVVDVDRPGARSIDFRSPVATQMGIRALPHFVIFDRAGRQALAGDKARAQVDQWIEQLPPPTDGTFEPTEPAQGRPSGEGQY